MVKDVDRLRLVELRSERASAKVGPQRAEAEDTIGPFDEGAHAFVGQAAVVDADVVRMRLVERGLVHDHGGERQARGIDSAVASRLRPARATRIPGRTTAVLARVTASTIAFTAFSSALGSLCGRTCGLPWPSTGWSGTSIGNAM